MAAPSELPGIADDLRSTLIEIGSEAGGHFAGSLGVVELTIALHYVFDTPRDRLVWDIGHQGYAHKALTGRCEQLRRVKQSRGPSGFLSRDESPYDVFGAGHAATSLSAAAGIAEGLRAAGLERRTVAVIGDGALTAGLSFEALHFIGERRPPVKIVFNDNRMSIAPNRGGLARTGRWKEYFECLGLPYLGPVDGHDVAVLVPVLRELRERPGPVVLHVRTAKGRGYPPAEKDPFRWHATTPFGISTGQRRDSGGGPPTWTAAFGRSLVRLAERDPRVVAITAAMPDGTGLIEFAARFPERFFDVGICEQNAVTLAAGMATEGLRPVCAIYSTFLQRAYDQVAHDVALQRLPVLFVLDRAGLVGGDGPTHHGLLDIAYLRPLPHLTIAAPRDENALQHLLATGLECPGPFALRIPRGKALGVTMDPDPKPIAIGKGEILREGDDVALVGIGRTIPVVQSVAAELSRSGAEATVVDARFAKPLDVALLRSVARRCGRVAIVEDHASMGGVGSAVLEVLATDDTPVRFRIFGTPDRFISHGSVDAQHAEAGIDTGSVFAAVRDWLNTT